MRPAPTCPGGHDLAGSGFVASVGEPLNPEAVRVGPRRARPAHPRQLVADRDRRDHDRQPRRVGRPPGLDGPAAARHRGGRAAPRRGRPGRGRRRRRSRSSTSPTRPASWPSAPAGRRCSAATSTRRALRPVLRRRLVPHRRPRPPRRRRLVLVRRPGRRRHQVRRPPDRPVRGRERPDGAPRRRRGRRHRRARPGRRRGRQGLRDPARRGTSRPTSCAWSCSASPARGSAPPSRPRAIAFDQHLPAHPERQDHAPAAPGPRARPARGRPLDPGGCRDDRRSTAVHLLRQMLLIRRFEERCVELYSAATIRGFLHLYIGEEAVAVGVMAALGPDDAVVATYREHGHALARGDPRRRGDGRDVRQGRGAAAGAGAARCTCSTPSRRFYGGNAIVGGGLPLAVGLALADHLQGRDRVTACFFGEGADGRGRVPRDDEPGRPVAAAGALLLREQPLRHGHRARPLGVPDRPGAEGRRLRDAGLDGRRHGRRGRGRRRPPRRAGGPGRRRPRVPRAAHLPLPGPLDVRPGALPRQGRGRARGASATRSTPLVAAPAGRRRARRRRRSPRSRPTSPPRSTPRWPSPRPGRWSPSRTSPASPTARSQR